MQPDSERSANRGFIAAMLIACALVTVVVGLACIAVAVSDIQSHGMAALVMRLTVAAFITGFSLCLCAVATVILARNINSTKDAPHEND